MPNEAPDTFSVVARNSAGYATDVRAGSHRLRSDEPASAGGTDTGPEPYELLLAALGACTAMTLRMYATRKGWPLQDVEVKLRHSRVWAQDVADAEHKTGRIDVIDCAIELHGPLDDEQRRRLLEISTHCPVHRTLTNEIKIRTELAP
jgi:putative redox protein